LNVYIPTHDDETVMNGAPECWRLIEKDDRRSFGSAALRSG
jgi:hypothetical protein